MKSPKAGLVCSQGVKANTFAACSRAQALISCSKFFLSPFFGWRIVFLFLSLFKILIYFIDYAITVVSFSSPLYSPLPCTSFPPSFPHLSSCPWVIHVSSLASPFPILFLTSPCLFSTYRLCYLFPVPFPHSLPNPSPLITLHVTSISMNLFRF